MYFLDEPTTRFGQIIIPPDPQDPGIVTHPPKIDPGMPTKPLGQPDPPDPADIASFLILKNEIKKQLDRNFRADDEPGYLDRRRRLRIAFQAVPKAFASDLLGHLLFKNDPLAKLFHYKLHDATQQEMIGILQRKLETL